MAAKKPRSAKQVAALKKAQAASAAARKRRSGTKPATARKPPAGAPKGSWVDPDSPPGGFVTQEAWGAAAWPNLADYTKHKAPKPKKVTKRSDWDEWKSGWGMGAG